MNADDLLEIEHRAWKALATDGAAGPFYDEVLAEEVLMLLPGGMVIDDRATVVESMSGAPWDDYDLRDERVVGLGPDAAMVAYRATATRGDVTYEALFNSTYVVEHGEWRLKLHQQTPVA
jgi:hypothetical protein